MITELGFSRNYASFWRELLPGGDDFIRIMNKAKIVDFGKQIQNIDEANRRALVNSIAFEVYYRYATCDYSNLSSIQRAALVDKFIEESKVSEIKRIQFLYKNTLSEIISANEKKVIKELFDGLLSRYNINTKHLFIKPVFNGCGLLFDAEADIIVDTKLVEIKAGARNFGIQDIRQLLIYGALNHVSDSHKYNINKFELYNPRMGVYWSESSYDVANECAGCSIEEVYNEIINFISDDYLPM